MRKEIWKMPSMTQKKMTSGGALPTTTAQAKQQPAANSGTSRASLLTGKTSNNVTPPPATPPPAPATVGPDARSQFNYGQSNATNQAGANVGQNQQINPVDPVAMQASMNPNYRPAGMTGAEAAGVNTRAASLVPQQTPQPQAQASGFNDFYGNLVDNDMANAQRDRDVTRAATLREAREAAIGQGIQAGTEGYRALMDDANASANIHSLQSRNDGATRSQGLMLQQRQEDQQNQDRLLDFLDNTQKEAYFKAISEGVDPQTAMSSLYNDDGTFSVKAPTATQQELDTKVEQIMTLDPSLSEAEARTRASSLLSESFGLQDKTLEDAAKVTERVPFVTENLAQGNTGAVGWTTDDFSAAAESNQLQQLTVPDLTGVGLNQNISNLGKNMKQGENVKIGGEYYRVDSFSPARNNPSYWESLTGGSTWEGGDAQLTAMTGPNAGKQISYEQAQKEGV